MKLLICIIKDYRKLDELLLGLVEIGVTGGTIVEGRGMGQVIGTELPIFASLRGLFPGSAQDSHLLLCAINDDLVAPSLQMIERILGSLSQPGTGIAFTLPIDQILGLKPEIAS